RSESLAPYLSYLEKLPEQVEELRYTYHPREENQFADALAELASMINIPNGMAEMPLMIETCQEAAYVHAIDDVEPDNDEPWFVEIQRYLQNSEYPSHFSSKSERALHLQSANFVLEGGVLYKRSPNGPNLRCVDNNEAQRVITVHAGVCGTHMNGKMLALKVIRARYYLTTLERDCYFFVKKCPTSQKCANLKHIPPSLLYSQSSPWPFSAWGIDVIGKVTPTGTGGYEFILVAIDYFTKWIEPSSFKVLGSKQVAQFIQENIICIYGVPHEFISDQGTHFQGECEDLFTEYKIQHHRSLPYRPQTNGAVEAANKNVKTIIIKMTTNYKDWPQTLHFALWEYRTSIRTSTGATPFSLVYGMESVQPIELEIYTFSHDSPRMQNPRSCMGTSKI
ncbi:hypothetical protein SOVF_018960, partial [Spinacia oleracea]